MTGVLETTTERKTHVGEKISRREFFRRCAGYGLALGAIPFLGDRNTVDALTRSVFGATGLSSHEASYYRRLGGNAVQCTLCPNSCTLQKGQAGICRVRENEGGRLYSRVYGYTARVRGDAMEKSPFYHFLPATSTVSLGTVGCNLRCLYCQNWQITQVRPQDLDPPPRYLPPESLVSQAKKYNRPAIVFTYSEPVIAIEYVLQTASLARRQGIKTLVKTGGFVNTGPMKDLAQAVDGINIDLKSFNSSFYTDVCGGALDTVLSSIKTAHQHVPWLELTYMVVPGYNDDVSQFAGACGWIKNNLGRDVPLHVSRFFPSYKLRNVEATPIDRLRLLRKKAYDTGLRYVYLGNLNGDPGESTYCPKCGIKMIKRVGYHVNILGLDTRTGRCTKCGLKIPGHWS